MVVLQENEHNQQQNDRLVEKQSIIDNIRRVFENKIGSIHRQQQAGAMQLESVSEFHSIKSKLEHKKASSVPDIPVNIDGVNIYGKWYH